MRYSKELCNFIANNVQGKSSKELAQLVNSELNIQLNESQIKAFKKNHKLTSGVPKGKVTGFPTKMYPLHIKEHIYQNYVGVGPGKMAKSLNQAYETHYSAAQIKAYYANHNLNSGNNGHFPVGNVPFTKGKKKFWTGGEGTQFVKGYMPHNFKPVGSESIIDGYTKVKIAEPKTWKHKHILVWEQHHGPVPKGHAVLFGDGNKQNFDIDNLILITKRQLITLNKKGLIQKNADLTRSAIIVADLFHKITDIAKR